MSETKRSVSAPPAKPKAVAAAAKSAEPATVVHDRTLWRARDIAIVGLAILATIVVAKFAAPLLIPVVLGLLLSYALRPLLTLLERVKIPRALGALLVMAGLVGAIGTMGWWIADDVATAVAELPTAARKLRSMVHRWQDESGPSTMSHMQEAATELGKTAAEVAGAKPTDTAPAAKVPEPASPTLASRLAANAGAVVGIAGEISIGLLLAGFMLAAGAAFRRKLVRIVGSSLAKRRITVEILDEIDTQVQRQLMILVASNLLIAFVCWIAFLVAGLGRATLWATIVGALHFIPYVGTAIATIAIAAVALVQTESFTSAFGFAALTATIAISIGFLLMGWWQGRAVRMNAVATFVTLLFFGWLWGAWGLILGGPLMAIVKVCADRIESLKSLGELLGE